MFCLTSFAKASWRLISLTSFWGFVSPTYTTLSWCFRLKASGVATLLWPSVGVKPNTWKKWGFGVLRCRNPSFGLATKAKGLQGCGPKGSPRVTSGTPGSVGKREGVNPHTPKTSETDLRGQISMACDALYMNGKILKRRCLKWSRIAHLDIWNASYDQKKVWESNSREFASFDSRPLKVGNRPEILGWRRRATYCWKALDESYNFALDRTSIRGLLAKLWGFKVPWVPQGGILRVPCGSPGREKPFACGSRGESQSIL
jgi:hypothetical protein